MGPGTSVPRFDDSSNKHVQSTAGGCATGAGGRPLALGIVLLVGVLLAGRSGRR
jgi:hypothetical protein